MRLKPTKFGVMSKEVQLKLDDKLVVTLTLVGEEKDIQPIVTFGEVS